MGAILSVPSWMTIRQIAKTGLLTEHALRLLVKQGKLPALHIGTKAMLEYDTVCEYVRKLAEQNLKERRQV